MLVWLLIASLAAQGWMLNGVALGWLLAKLCDCTLLSAGEAGAGPGRSSL